MAHQRYSELSDNNNKLRKVNLLILTSETIITHQLILTFWINLISIFY